MIILQLVAKWGVRVIHKSSQMCIQANTDTPSALWHIIKNISERQRRSIESWSHQQKLLCWHMPFFCRIFNMPDFTSTCWILLQLEHAVFFPEQFQHAGFFVNMPDSAAPFFNMPFLYLQHAVFFCSNFNMPDSAAPFFNMPFFIPSTCLFFLQQFQHAGFSSTIF